MINNNACKAGAREEQARRNKLSFCCSGQASRPQEACWLFLLARCLCPGAHTTSSFTTKSHTLTTLSCPLTGGDQSGVGSGRIRVKGVRASSSFTICCSSRFPCSLGAASDREARRGACEAALRCLREKSRSPVSVVSWRGRGLQCSPCPA